MQDTRRHILEILKARGQGTVDEIVAELRLRRGAITAVTVRHHLSRLQEEQLITTPKILHRNVPGRPQHVYTLTDEARSLFPNNYEPLTAHLLAYLSDQMPSKQVNVILEGVAGRMAADANIAAGDLSEQLDVVVDYLNKHGYNAEWEPHPDGYYVLRTSNCPYHRLAESNKALCEMDMKLISSLLGVVPRLLGRLSAGDASCAYMIPAPDIEQASES